jgi:hypothetical protein
MRTEVKKLSVLLFDLVAHLRAYCPSKGRGLYRVDLILYKNLIIISLKIQMLHIFNEKKAFGNLKAYCGIGLVVCLKS